MFPAPLRLIFLLAKRVYRSKKQGASGREEVAKQKTKYIFLVRQLVKMAVQPEQKGAEEDDKMFLKERVRELKKENSEEKAEKIRLQEEVRRLQESKQGHTIPKRRHGRTILSVLTRTICDFMQTPSKNNFVQVSQVKKK